jgi:hypothetical protein
VLSAAPEGEVRFISLSSTVFPRAGIIYLRRQALIFALLTSSEADRERLED